MKRRLSRRGRKTCLWCGVKISWPRTKFCSSQCGQWQWRFDYLVELGVNYTTQQQRDKRKRENQSP